MILFAAASDSLVQQTVERTKHDAIPSLIMYMIPRRHPRCTPMLFSCLNGNAPPNSTPLEPKCPLTNTLGNTRDLCAASFSGGLCDGADISLVNASRDFAATTSKMGQKAEPKKGRAHAVVFLSSCWCCAARAAQGTSWSWPTS